MGEARKVWAGGHPVENPKNGFRVGTFCLSGDGGFLTDVCKQEAKELA